MAATQLEVYEEFKPAIDDVLGGYNTTIFAYGQTGSGKTHSMFGPDVRNDQLMGIIPRAAKQIFDHLHQLPSAAVVTVKMSFLEIYKEQVRDLLSPTEDPLRVRESKETGVYVDGLSQSVAKSHADMLALITKGEKSRTVASTRMNEVSSRSHSLVIVTVEQRIAATADTPGSVKIGTLNLADLAGSEKVGKTGTEGERLEEAKTINMSLSALGLCIRRLATSSPHIPYRDSKLTFILRESLGGNAKTNLLVATSPHAANLEETLSTLEFANRAKSIKLNVRVNQSALLVAKPKQELAPKANAYKDIPTSGLNPLFEVYRRAAAAKRAAEVAAVTPEGRVRAAAATQRAIARAELVEAEYLADLEVRKKSDDKRRRAARRKAGLPDEDPSSPASPTAGSVGDLSEVDVDLTDSESEPESDASSDEEVPVTQPVALHQRPPLDRVMSMSYELPPLTEVSAPPQVTLAPRNASAAAAGPAEPVSVQAAAPAQKPSTAWPAVPVAVVTASPVTQPAATVSSQAASVVAAPSVVPQAATVMPAKPAGPPPAKPSELPPAKPTEQPPPTPVDSVARVKPSEPTPAIPADKAVTVPAKPTEAPPKPSEVPPKPAVVPPAKPIEAPAKPADNVAAPAKPSELPRQTPAEAVATDPTEVVTVDTPKPKPAVSTPSTPTTVDKPTEQVAGKITPPSSDTPVSTTSTASAAPSTPKAEPAASSPAPFTLNEPIVDTPMVAAIKSGDDVLQKVSTLIQQGSDVNAADAEGTTALHVAARAGDRELVTLLLQRGANVNAGTRTGVTPLLLAIQSERIDVAILLIQSKANVNLADVNKVRALHAAAARGLAEVGLMLIEAGAKVNIATAAGITPLHAAIRKGDEDFVRILLDNGADVNAKDASLNQPMHVAAASSTDLFVKLLVDHGAPLSTRNGNGRTPLHAALIGAWGRQGAGSKTPIVIRTIIDIIAHGEANYLFQASDKEGRTPLHMAVEMGDLEAADLLLHQPYADVNLRDKLGNTVLHIAALRGMSSMVAELIDGVTVDDKFTGETIEHHADAMVTNAAGNTPLHLAAHEGFDEVVLILIADRVDVNAANNNGDTPLHLAAAAGHFEVMMMLVENGALLRASNNANVAPLDLVTDEVAEELIVASTAPENLTSYDKSDSEDEAPPPPPPLERPVMTRDEMVAMMVHGEVFVKHGRTGKPHLRDVWASEDMTALHWCQAGKPRSSTTASESFPLQSLRSIEVGHTTPVFARTGRPETAQCCFSLVGEKRTLDLEADSMQVALNWSFSLKAVLRLWSVEERLDLFKALGDRPFETKPSAPIVNIPPIYEEPAPLLRARSMTSPVFRPDAPLPTTASALKQFFMSKSPTSEKRQSTPVTPVTAVVTPESPKSPPKSPKSPVVTLPSPKTASAEGAVVVKNPLFGRKLPVAR
eukprot:TRINITY_DN9445_c0_g1_i1.p1 TRINITY_DN9445_c0_g1~~TRINITY_DN9445_c0_g1_i1.p1  ORF type:complete len:1511 (-),score=407.47 TRINITY_DN9445_c0_g1_i1:142-4404(-)